MKITKNSFLLRFSLSLAMLLGVFAGLKAENKIYIKPFTLDNYNTYMMPVELDLDEDLGVNSFQFDIKLPEQLQFAGTKVEKALDRVSENDMTVRFNTSNGCVMLFADGEGATVKGLTGPVVLVPVVAVPGSLEKAQQLEITLEGLKLGHNKPGTDIVEGLPVTTQPTTVTLSSVKIWGYTPEATLTVNPGGTANLQIAISNNIIFRDFQASITLPEGFELGTAELSDRCDVNTKIRTKRNTPTMYTIAAVNFEMVPCFTGHEGVVFTLPVTIPADFAAETAEIVISNWIFSDGNDGMNTSAIYPPAGKEEVKFTIVNGANAHAKALAEVKTLEDALAAALTEIGTTCPDVKDDFTGAEITAKIEALKEAIETAYEDGSLTPDYDQVMAPAAGIADEINALVADAKEAQKAFEDEGAAAAARQEAYDKAMAEVKTLEDALAAALETIATECPDVKDNFKGETVAQQIADMKAAIEAAMEDKTILEKYESLVAPKTAITEAIGKLVADAQAAQTAFNAEKALAEAKANADAKVKELQAALAAALETIATECPDVKDNFKGDAIKQDITDLKTDILGAYVDKTLATEYETVVTEPATAIEAAIAKLIEDAKAAQTAYNDEEARVAANKEAYDLVIATLNQLQETLDETKQQLEAQYPDADMTAEIAAIEKEIADARAQADKDYQAVATEGLFDTEPYIAIVENVNNEIINLQVAAGEKQNESDRIAANKEAYDLVIASLDQLREALDETKQQLDAQYPDIDMAAEIAAIEKEIADAREQADKDYEAVAEEGTFSTEPYAEIVENINNEIINLPMIAADKKAQADEEARQAANQAAYDATLAEIAELQAELDAMTILVAEQYPEADVEAEIKIAQDAIDALTAGAQEAFEAVAEEGTYEYTVDADSVKDLIKQIKDQAEALGIEEITADMIGKDVKIYNLQGVRVSTPTTDAIHVIVSNDGTVRKVVIK